MKAIICAITLLTIMLSGIVKAQTLSDITGDTEQFSMMVPGLACKTRTNNEATVRNLAHGVWNRDSASPVALNCGWMMPGGWSRNAFPNSARLDGQIFVVFHREAGTDPTTAANSFCTISVSNESDVALNPQTNGVQLGTLSPDFGIAAADAEIRFPAVSTGGVIYPGFQNFFSAFCRIEQGVRIQLVIPRADTVNTF